MQEVPPVRVADVAHRRGDWERFWRFRLPHQTQAGFVRETVGFEGIDFLLRPNEVLERITAAAVAWDDVVQVAAILADEFAGILADTPITLADRRTRDARNTHRHAVELGRDDDRRHAEVDLRRR